MLWPPSEVHSSTLAAAVPAAPLASRLGVGGGWRADTPPAPPRLASMCVGSTTPCVSDGAVQMRCLRYQSWGTAQLKKWGVSPDGCVQQVPRTHGQKDWGGVGAEGSHASQPNTDWRACQNPNPYPEPRTRNPNPNPNPDQ